MTDYLLISTTTATADQAQQLATALVENRLAACVQIVPQIKSIYRWQEKIEQAEEQLCLIKTRRDLFPQVEAEIQRIHSYECPEIVTIPIEAASAAYSTWLNDQLQQQS